MPDATVETNSACLDKIEKKERKKEIEKKQRCMEKIYRERTSFME